MNRITASITVALVAVGAMAAPAGASTTHPTTKTHHVKSDHASDYEVVLGFRQTMAGADKLVTRAADKGFTATVEKGTKPLEVEIPGFATKAAAKSEAVKARKAGLKGAFAERS
jgi:hypothetical protein